MDSTPATTLDSPTHQRVLPTAIPFPRSNDRRYRTYSEADRLSLDSLSLNGSQDGGSSHTSSASPEQGRLAKERMSTGSQGLGRNVGAAIRSLTGLKSRRDGSEGSVVGENEGRRGSLDYSSASSSPEERRAERRREVEAILRRSSKGSK